jgi:hypothetical protein
MLLWHVIIYVQNMATGATHVLDIHNVEDLRVVKKDDECFLHLKSHFDYDGRAKNCIQVAIKEGGNFKFQFKNGFPRNAQRNYESFAYGYVDLFILNDGLVLARTAPPAGNRRTERLFAIKGDEWAQVFEGLGRTLNATLQLSSDGTGRCVFLMRFDGNLYILYEVVLPLANYKRRSICKATGIHVAELVILNPGFEVTNFDVKDDTVTTWTSHANSELQWETKRIRV